MEELGEMGEKEEGELMPLFGCSYSPGLQARDIVQHGPATLSSSAGLRVPDPWLSPTSDGRRLLRRRRRLDRPGWEGEPRREGADGGWGA
jgi:hypothetical protein